MVPGHFRDRDVRTAAGSAICVTGTPHTTEEANDSADEEQAEATSDACCQTARR